MMKLIIPLLVVVPLYAMLFAIPILIPTSNYIIVLRLLVISVIMALQYKGLKLIFYNEVISENIRVIASSVSVLLLFLLVIECIFMFIPRSRTSGYDYATRNWFRYYWKPVNSYWFRDEEPSLDKRTILFVGDSFTAGHGIKNVKDRYSNVIGRERKDYVSVNIGICGADTRKEYDGMVKFIRKSKVQPVTIVLQYYGNDIEEVASENSTNICVPAPYQDINIVGRAIVRGSYVANYLYWLYPHGENKTYIDYLNKAYNDPQSCTIHMHDLGKFIDYSQTNSIQLVVVVFPFMQNVSLSKGMYTDKITAFFRDRGISTVDVGLLLSDLRLQQLVVNNNDSHASIEVNKRVAREIMKLLK